MALLTEAEVRRVARQKHAAPHESYNQVLAKEAQSADERFDIFLSHSIKDAELVQGVHLILGDMVAVRITRDLRPAIVCSPDYLIGRSAPATPRDLREHACIGYRQATSGALYRWEFERGDDVLEVAVEGPHTLDDPDLMVAAALDGVGLAYAIEGHVAEQLAAGRLVRVLEEWCQPFPGFFLYYPSRRQIPAALRALIDFLRVRE